MPGPRQPSIPLLAFTPTSPIDWAQFTTTESQFLRIRGTIRGLPHGWLRSVERTVRMVQRSGIVVREPLNYRLAALAHGTVNLQEAKYLSDVLENSLRHAFVRHVEQHAIPWSCIAAATPALKSLSDVVPESTYAIRDAVLHMTFYQLTESMARHWRRIRSTKGVAPGFRRLFWSSTACRDVNLFRSDVRAVRSLRNDVAHTRRLVLAHELGGLVVACLRWLTPLGVDVESLVSLYRSKRPQFLSQRGVQLLLPTDAANLPAVSLLRLGPSHSRLPHG